MQLFLRACAAAGPLTVATLALSPALAAEPAAVQWTKTPSATLDPLSWPERALRMEVDGVATLRCAYDAQGILSDCKVVSETPSSFAFGIAALRMAKVFRLRSTLSDGSKLAPGEITFPVPFVAEEFSDPRPAIFAAPQPGSRKTPIVVAKADRVVFPDGQRPPAVFPARALAEGKPGAATVLCLVAEDGRLTKCSVSSETDKGYGYGKAAVELSRYFRMNATTVDGVPLAGRWISLKQTFALE